MLYQLSYQAPGSKVVGEAYTDVPAWIYVLVAHKYRITMAVTES